MGETRGVQARRGDDAGFFNLVQYGPGGEAAARILKKGRQVAFDGRAEHCSWQAKDGTSRQAPDYVGHIDFLADRPAAAIVGRTLAAQASCLGCASCARRTAAVPPRRAAG